MFIIIIGTRASGKSTLLNHLVNRKSFIYVTLRSSSRSNSKDTEYTDSKSDSGDTLLTRLGREKAEHKASGVSSQVKLQQALPPETAARENHGLGLQQSLNFRNHEELLNYVTSNWRNHFVTSDLRDSETLNTFSKRPFVLVVNLDAPLLVRFERARCLRDINALELQQFIVENDRLMYGRTQGDPHAEHATDLDCLYSLLPLANVSILNDFPTVDDFLSQVDSLDLLDVNRLRPSWDTYFMTLATLASMRSNCMKRRVGAILVRNNRVVSTGYNGTPRGIKNCSEGGCTRCNGAAASGTALDECLCLHAEENALLEAGSQKMGGGGVVLYCNTCPCLRCTVKIVQTGVSEVIYNLAYKVDEASAKVFREAGVILRQHSPPQ